MIALLITHNWPIGGTTRWAREMISGFIEADISFQVIRHRGSPKFTDSDIVVRSAEEALTALQTCDAVLVQSAIDLDTLKRKRVWWLDVLLSDRCPPWFNCTHDDASRQFVENPFMRELSDSPSNSRHFFGFSQHDTDVFHEYSLTQHTMELPFTTSKASFSRDGAQVLMPSQITRVKNWIFICRLAEMWSEDVTKPPVEFVLAGRGASSPAVAMTNQVAEYFRERGVFVTDIPNLHRPTPWEAKFDDGTTLKYHGEYVPEDIPELMSSATVALNATHRRLGTNGPAEYVTLEAIDNGVQAVLPIENALAAPHLNTHEYTYPDRGGRYYISTKVIRGAEDETMQRVFAAVDRAIHSPYDQTINKASLSLINDPTRIATKVAEIIKENA